jgi:hypothetical protein
MTPTVPVRMAISCQAFQAGLDAAAAARDLVMRPVAVRMARFEARRESAAGVAAERAVMTLKTLLTFW